MSPSTRNALALAAGVLLIGGWIGRAHLLDAGGAESPPGEDRGEETRFTFAYRWPAGEEALYRVRFEAESHARPFRADARGSGGEDPGVAVTLSFRGIARLRSHGPVGDATLLSLDIASIEAASLRYRGQPLWSVPRDAEVMLEGRELVFEADATGQFGPVQLTDAEDDRLAVLLLRSLASELQLVIAPNAPREERDAIVWEGREETQLGIAETRLRVREARGVREGTTPYRVTRSRPRYARLVGAPLRDIDVLTVQSRHDAVLDAGRLRRIHGEERVDVHGPTGHAIYESVARIDATLIRVQPFEGERPEFDRDAARALSVVALRAEAARASLESRADGLTIEAAMRILSEHGPSGRVPEHSRFLWRAAALLELDPANCRALTPLYTGPRANARLRGLLVDLISATQSPGCQEVMRAWLDGSRRDPMSSFYVQRTGFLADPTPETAEFVEAWWRDGLERGDEDAAMAGAYALGSIADQLEDVGEDALAGRYVDALRDAAEEAPAGQTVHYLRAIDNAARPEDRVFIAGYASDGDPNVRHAVAAALDGPTTDVGLETLLVLAADRNQQVQHRALRSLEPYALTAEAIETLRGIVAGGRLDADNLRAMANLARVQQAARPSEVEALLRALLELDVDDRQARSAVARLLGEN